MTLDFGLCFFESIPVFFTSLKMCGSYKKLGSFVSILIAIIAVWYARDKNNVDLSAEIPNILSSLQKAESKV